MTKIQRAVGRFILKPFAAPAAITVALWPVYVSTLAPGLTWANYGSDGGDLVAAAAGLGVAHPTGYPTYLLLARLFQFLPVGALAFRTNLMSAVCAALAGGVVARTVIQNHAGSRRSACAGGLVAGLALGLSSILWSQAVITEVYALHALFVVLILAALPSHSKSDTGQLSHSSTGISGLIFGLALGNSLTMVLLFPAWLALTAEGGRDGRWKRLFTHLGWCAVGLAVYLYIPLRASAMPAVNWGNAARWEGFWWLVSGRPYQGLVFGLPPAYTLTRIAAWGGLVVREFGWLGMLVSVYGLFYGAMRSPGLRILTVWAAAVSSAFAIGYNTADSFAYLLPAFVAQAIWLGIGLATALDSLPHRRRLWQLALVGVLLGSVALNAVLVLPEVDASRDRRAETYGRAVLAQAPPRALVFTSTDRDTFVLWYFHLALRERPDIAVVVVPLLGFDWYRANLSALYPDLTVPEPPAADLKAALIAANGRTACDTALESKPELVCNP